MILTKSWSPNTCWAGRTRREKLSSSCSKRNYRNDCLQRIPFKPAISPPAAPWQTSLYFGSLSFHAANLEAVLDSASLFPLVGDVWCVEIKRTWKGKVYRAAILNPTCLALSVSISLSFCFLTNIRKMLGLCFFALFLSCIPALLCSHLSLAWAPVCLLSLPGVPLSKSHSMLWGQVFWILQNTGLLMDRTLCMFFSPVRMVLSHFV